MPECKPDDDEYEHDDEPIDDQAREDLLFALMDGNGAAAAHALRHLRDPIDDFVRGLLADMLEGNPSQHSDFPWRLKMVGRRSGRPENAWSRQATWHSIWKRVKEAQLRTGKLESAITEVRQRLGFSRSKIFKAYSYMERRYKAGKSDR
jgi:hypothetical protein